MQGGGSTIFFIGSKTIYHLMDEFDSVDWTAGARALVDGACDLRPGLPAYLYIRHSHRESPASGPVPRDMPITALGERMATELGYRLSRATARPTLIFHSPLYRCQQTAKAIHAGFRKGGRDVEMRGKMDELLNLTTDAKKKAIIEEKHGYDYVNYWLMGFYQALDMEPATRYGQRVVEKMLRETSSTPCPLVIMIGHDDTLLGLRGVLAGIAVDSSWLSFLGGFWIQLAPDDLLYADAKHHWRRGPYPCWWQDILARNE
jgi:broad specificity phosphatase PhoE